MPGRYATALFELAQDAGELEAVEKDLAGFETMLNESEDLQRLVRSPVFTAAEQVRAISAILAKTDFSTLTTNFVSLVAKNRRLFAVRDMVRAFRALLAAHRGEVTADVTSATSLSDAQVSALKESLKAAVGKDVQLNTHVDESLLGGLVVKVGSRMVDSSLKTKLQSLKIAMKEVG